MFKVKKKKVCTGFREHEAFSEETLLKLAYEAGYLRNIVKGGVRDIKSRRFDLNDSRPSKT